MGRRKYHGPGYDSTVEESRGAISLVEDNPRDVYLPEKALDHHHIAYELTPLRRRRAGYQVIFERELPRTGSNPARLEITFGARASMP